MNEQTTLLKPLFLPALWFFVCAGVRACVGISLPRKRHVINLGQSTTLVIAGD